MSYPADLRAVLTVARSSRDLLNGGPKDAVLPGLFIRVYRNEGYDDLLGVGDQADRQVTLEQALAIADAFDAAAGLGPRTRDAVLSAARTLAQEIEGQIAATRARIQALPSLEAQLAQLEARRGEFPT